MLLLSLEPFICFVFFSVLGKHWLKFPLLFLSQRTIFLFLKMMNLSSFPSEVKMTPVKDKGRAGLPAQTETAQQTREQRKNKERIMRRLSLITIRMN